MPAVAPCDHHSFAAAALHDIDHVLAPEQVPHVAPLLTLRSLGRALGVLGHFLDQGVYSELLVVAQRIHAGAEEAGAVDAGAVVHDLVQCRVVVRVGRGGSVGGRWREEVVDVDEGVGRAAEEEVRRGGVE